jgi:hypothetical protein
MTKPDALTELRWETQREERARIAEEIRRELVCCDIYDRAEGSHGAILAAERAGHAICFWGEAAARIAEKG